MSKNIISPHILKLHFVVFLWGFTGILGKLLDNLETVQLVWYRVFIASIVMGGIIVAKRIKIKTTPILLFKVIMTGFVIFLHWMCFYGALKVSNVSVALASFSCTSLFTGIFEPLILKKKFERSEIFLGIGVILIMTYIFNAEVKYWEGILLGIGAAVTTSFFTVINSTFANKMDAYQVSIIELLSVLFFSTIYFICFDWEHFPNFIMEPMDYVWILILGVLCTVYTFVASIHLMKHLSPFTISLTVNLEPVYAILLAFVIFKEYKFLSVDFFIGTTILIFLILSYPIIKRKFK